MVRHYLEYEVFDSASELPTDPAWILLSLATSLSSTSRSIAECTGVSLIVNSHATKRTMEKMHLIPYYAIVIDFLTGR